MSSTNWLDVASINATWRIGIKTLKPKNVDQPTPFHPRGVPMSPTIGNITARQGGYASRNHYAGLMATNKEYVSDNDTAKTIAAPSVSTLQISLHKWQQQLRPTQYKSTHPFNSLQTTTHSYSNSNRWWCSRRCSCQSTRKPHHPTINTSTRPHKSMPHPPCRVSNSSTSRGEAGVAAEAAAVLAVPDVAKAEEVEAFQCPPIHSWEVTWSRTSQPGFNLHNKGSNFIFPTSWKHLLTRMSATAVDLMLKIGAQVPCATLRRGATRTVSIVWTTWSMNVQTTLSVAKQCKRLCTQAFNGVGRWMMQSLTA